MKTNVMAVAVLSVFPAFSVSAQNNSVLDFVREEANLFSYQLEATRSYCEDLQDNVFPALNALDLTEEFSALFDRDLVRCDIRYGQDGIRELRGEYLFSVGRGFDNEGLAKSIMRVLSTDERLRVAEHLQLPGM